MLDLRSHRASPYQDSLVSHRRSSSRTAARGGSMPLRRLDEEPVRAPATTATATAMGRFHSGQTTLSLRTPERRRLRLFRTTQKLNQQQEQEHCQPYFGEGETMDTEVDVAEEQETGAIVDDQEMSSMDVDQDKEELPAILRLCPEVLALIFHYVYVTPVVHRPPVAVVAVKPSSSSDTDMQQEALAQTPQQQGQNGQESPTPMATEEDRSSSQDMSNTTTTTPTSSLSLSSPPPSSSSTSSTSSLSITAPTTTAIITSDPPTRTTTTTTTSSGVSTTRRTKKDKRVSSSSVYIQNDLSSMLSLCLTCRAFYPQAIRMLWRQRTLTNFDELTQFYQAIDFSAALTKRHQKQRHLLQQQQQHQEMKRLRLGMGYAMEEGLFTNKAALRIKSLTLLDMSLGSSLATLPLAAVVASANASTSLSTSGESTLSNNPFFGSSSHHAGDPASLDLCQGIDSLPRTSSALDDSLAMAGLSKEDATTANASLSSSSSSSSSGSSSSSSAMVPHSPTQSRRRHRQKTTSIYSDMVSPRLLHTIAHHCHALVDLTLCMDKKSPSGINSSVFPARQPTIPLSILAGSLLSLKRLALMGLACDPQQNKTASELLVFAQNIQPLEQLSIRSCQGIGLETFVEFASRSNRRLVSVDFQGLDFKTSQELTDVMAAFAVHCRNVKSVTLSCLNSLALDGMLEALAYYGASELQELHVLGHDTFLTPAQIQQQQQQQQQGLAGAPAPGAVPQQEQQPQQQQQQQGPDNNNNNNNNINADGGVPVPFTQMCHLADANAALSSLARISLRRLTLYCPGITDYALLLYLAQAKHLVDLVLQEPTTMVIHHPQFHSFVQQYHPAGPPSAPTDVASDQLAAQAPMGSSSFLGLIRARCTGLKYLFMKLTLETAQEWIAQECFRQAGLDKCLYQYRTASGAPAVVLMWDSRTRLNAPAPVAPAAAL